MFLCLLTYLLTNQKYRCEQASTSADKEDDDGARRPDSPRSPLTSPASDCCPGPHSARRPLTVYCRDCDRALCESCFIMLHNGHQHANVDEVSVDLRRQLKDDVDKLASVAVGHNDRLNIMQVKPRLHQISLICSRIHVSRTSNMYPSTCK